MYDQCLHAFDKKKEASLWLLVITSNSNTIKRAIKAAAYSSGSSSAIMVSLEERGYVQEYEPGYYSLTAEGILYVEREVKKLGDGELVDWVNKKMLIKNKTISDKNRVILLSLLSCRCFSNDTCASYAEPIMEKAFLQILKKSNRFLLAHNIISADVVSDGGHNSSKSPVSKILDQIDKLPASSGMIFKAHGSKKYYLDVVKDDEIDCQSITLLAKIILGDNVNYDSILDLKQFCKDSYMEFGYIFRTGDSSFEGPINDYMINAGFDNALL